MIGRPLQNAAWADVTGAVRLRWLIGAVGWLDIQLRYRGSWLGPLWLSLFNTIMVAVLGLVYPTLFHLPARDYVPYLAVSLVLWNALARLKGRARGAEILVLATHHDAVQQQWNSLIIWLDQGHISSDSAVAQTLAPYHDARPTD